MTSTLISYEAALGIILQHRLELRAEDVFLEGAAGRSLFRDHYSMVDLPPFLTSSVDGWAVTLPTKSPLTIAGELPAGFRGEARDIDSGSSVQVFTGSKLPGNTSAVIMDEDASVLADRLSFGAAPSEGENLRPKGEELTAGQLIGQSGELVNPPLLALLASSGNHVVSVTCKPVVSLVEVGNELHSPGETLEASGIYACNGLGLDAACKLLGAETRRYRCSDDLDDLTQTLKLAHEGADVVITSGGVSVGKHDHVKAVWGNLGATQRFWGVAIRPGRPLFYALMGNCSIFGLPGNPVSTLVTFYLFVRPLLCDPCLSLRKPQKVKTSHTIESSPDVEIFQRVVVSDGVALPLFYQRSHMLSGLTGATHLLRVPRSLGKIPVGSVLNALPLSWNN